MNLQDIYSSLDTMSVDDLRDLNSAVVHTIKAKRKQQAQIKKLSLKVGDMVSFNGKKGEVVKGEIAEIKRTKAIVRQDNALRSRWNVPIAMLNKIEKKTKFNIHTGEWE